MLPSISPANRTTRLLLVAALSFVLVNAAHAAIPEGSPKGAASGDDGSACASPVATVGTTTPRTLAPAALDHYARIAALSGEPRPEQRGLDRQQFSLATMNPAYLKVIDVKPAYLDVPPATFRLPEFPANSSQQTRAELDHLLELQARRTPEEIAYSQKLAGVYYRLSVRPEDQDWPRMRQNLFHMGHQLGPWFSPESLPVTADFMARVWSDASYYLWAAKFRFNRVRPYTIEPRLENVETPNFPAYPSGHSSNSYVAAYVYELLLPEHRDLFVRNARDMAYSREILGVHFASDSEAGRIFARQFVDRLMQEPAFRTDLEAARREIQKVMAAQPAANAHATRDTTH
ncbi:MAG TPA: phosphatase PAP2 family protein [Thermoanaerobaculia bacterium]